MKVLFIDSGIGGLTTLAQTVKIIPNLNFIYYADDKYSPYGSLNSEQIVTRLKTIINKFLNHNIGMVVLACNTATACGIDILRNIYNFPIIGTEPAIKPASEKNNRIIVLATPATTKNNRFFKLVKNCPCSVEITPMPALAKQIDNYYLLGDALSKDEIDITINHISHLAEGKTHIVLGCTHYVHLKRLIKSRTKKQVIDGNLGVACRVKSLISDKFLSIKPKQKFILSSKNKHFAIKYKKIFLQTLANIDNVW